MKSFCSIVTKTLKIITKGTISGESKGFSKTVNSSEEKRIAAKQSRNKYFCKGPETPQPSYKLPLP